MKQFASLVIIAALALTVGACSKKKAATTPANDTSMMGGEPYGGAVYGGEGYGNPCGMPANPCGGM